MLTRLLRRPKLYSPQLILDALEERIVLDAAVPVTSTQDHNDNASSGAQSDSTSDTASQTGSESGGTNTASPELNVVIISNTLAQTDALSAAVADGSIILSIDGHSGTLDGLVSQLKEIVDQTGQKIGQLAVLTHGDPGVLKLSDVAVFSANTVKDNPLAWETLSSLLAVNAKIELFGCDIGQGEAGANLVQQISSLTHASVWASDDTTGNVENADWILEVHSGSDDKGSLLDGQLLSSYSIALDDSAMTNPGFETGDLTGWTVTIGTTSGGSATVVSASTGGNYSGYDAGSSPYSATSNYMLRIDDWNTNTSDPSNPTTVSQSFTYDYADTIAFAYNFVTHDGDPYTTYDDFGYTLLINNVEVLSYLIHSGDVSGNRYQAFSSTGWQTVTIDPSDYGAQIGDTLTLQITAGNTEDSAEDSWAFIDMKPVPTADSYSVLVNYETPITFTVEGHDSTKPDVSSVSFQLVSGSTYGSLTYGALTTDGAGNYYQVVTYTPNSGYSGDDNFTFKLVVSEWKGFAATTGTSVATGSYTEWDMQFGKLDSNSYPDLITADANTDLTAQNNYFYLNSSSGFGSATNMDSNGTRLASYAMAVGDFNKDGYTDVVVKDYNGVAKVYLWNGSSFSPTGGTSLGSNSSSTYGGVAVGDVDTDGDLDIVVAKDGSAAVVYKNNGSGTFDTGTAVTATLSSWAVKTIQLADFNNDGNLDLYLGRYGVAEGDVILEGNGSGGFTTAHVITGSGSENRRYSAVGDVDGDGYIDIVVADSGTGTASINKFYKNNGSWNFTVSNIGTQQEDSRSIRLADLDSDGDLDVLVANNGSSSKVYLYNNQTDSFGTPYNIGTFTGTNTYSMAVADTNQNGTTDVVLGISGSANLLFLNQGNYTADSNTAEVKLHVGNIKNPSFQSNYDNWSLDERTTEDDPEYLGTFAILADGTSVDYLDVFHDYYDGNEQVQHVFWPFTIDDGGTVDADHLIAVQLANGPRIGTIYQDFVIPSDVDLSNVQLTFSLAYWNNSINFDAANQYIAVYIYNSTDTTSPTAVWKLTSGDLIQSTMTDITIDFPDTLTGSNIRIAFEVASLDMFFYMAIDNVRLSQTIITAPLSVTSTPSTGPFPDPLSPDPIVYRDDYVPVPVVIPIPSSSVTTAVELMTVSFQTSSSTDSTSTLTTVSDSSSSSVMSLTKILEEISVPTVTTTEDTTSTTTTSVVVETPVSETQTQTTQTSSGDSGSSQSTGSSPTSETATSTSGSESTTTDTQPQDASVILTVKNDSQDSGSITSSTDRTTSFATLDPQEPLSWNLSVKGLNNFKMAADREPAAAVMASAAYDIDRMSFADLAATV